MSPDKSKLTDIKHRYLFILEIAPIEEGKIYNELPSHLTLMSRFFSKLTPAQLSENARLLFDKTAPMNLTIGETTELGPKKLTVHLVEYSDRLRSLHDKLLTSLQSLDTEFEYPQFVGNGHKPHITTREGVRFSLGDTLLAGYACLVEVVGGKRIIRSKFELGSTQAFTQKYTIIQLFEDIPEGTQFASSGWPLHATVVDTFAIDWDVPTMVTKLETLLSTHQQAASVAEDDTFFGSEKQTQVVILRKTDELVRLHHDVIELLERGGIKLNDPQFARSGFLPHATVQKHARLHKGDSTLFNALTLIDMFPGEDPYQRKVLKTIKIGQK